MPFFKAPGTESHAGDRSPHTLLLCVLTAHWGLHILVMSLLPAGEISLRVSGIKPLCLVKLKRFLSSITEHKQTAHCPPVSTLKLYPGIYLVASHRNPAHILGRVRSGVVLKGREEGEGMPRACQASSRYYTMLSVFILES